MNLDEKLTYSIKRGSYLLSENTKQLFNVSKLAKDGFSDNGEELVICLLSLNRVHLTIRLLASIEYYLPNFKGDVLIIDNNSTDDQKGRLREFAQTSDLNIRICELKENLGVGKARNYAAQETNKKWIMFLDNDMYFVSNPLPAVKRTIEELGVQFLNFPLINYDNKTVFALGGALFTWPHEKSFFSGGGSCFNFKREVEYQDVNIEAPFLSDFLFGGASVINRQKFIDLGGFDKNMFVGFEDIDFSLRLYNNGFKVGNINEFVLVHNHKPSNNVDDIEAEKKRFSNCVIKTSAEAFEKKNGVIVYDHHTEEWLKQRQADLINKKAFQPVTNANGAKKRIALVVDVKEWAFHNIAKNIVKHLSDKYDFTIYFQSEYAWEKWLDIYPILYQEKHDMILFFWRPVYKHLYSKDLENYLDYKFGIKRKDFENFLNETVLLTGVYDHLFLTEADIEKHSDIYTNNIDGYFVSSNKLKEIYDGIQQYPVPYNVIQDGVDTSRFFKLPGKEFSKKTEPLIVGWAGNSNWGVSEDGLDHKGFNSIVKPAIQELINEGYPIKLIYADKQEPATHVAPSEMNNFYNKLDVYICASDIEGTPNPVLESMACELGIITTDVGIVREVFGKEQKKFILKERTKEELKMKLLSIIKDRSILKVLAKENFTRINNWTWESKCERFDEMFEYYFHKQSINKLHYKKFPFTTSISTEPVSEIHTVTEAQTAEDSTPVAAAVEIDWSKYVAKEEYDETIRQALTWQQNAGEIKDWYNKEYEVLPLWYKRVGHVIKAIKGKRSIKSLLPGKDQ